MMLTIASTGKAHPKEQERAKQAMLQIKWTSRAGKA